DLQVSTLQPDGSWGPPTWLPELSSVFTDTAPTVRGDGLEIIFHRGTVLTPQGLPDLWSATRASVDDPWSAPVNLGRTVNADGISDEEPFLTADGRTLYFDSTRPGGPGSGNFDLYVSTRNAKLTVTADDQSRLFGQANPRLTYDVAGFV